MLKSDPEVQDIEFETYQKFLLDLDQDYKFFKSAPVQEKRKYVITSAQMSTPVNEDFLKCLEIYCEENDAQLMVIPYRYNNPTSIWGTGSKEEYIAPAVEKYLMTEHIELTPMLQVLGDVKIVATAVQPIHGMDSLTGNASGIIGHPKVQLTTIATPQKDLPKIMSSTGAITVPNYTISKAGKRAESHHSFSAIIVELEEGGKRFHMRHMTYDGKGFYDLDKYYSAKGVRDSEGVAALVMGDIHAIYFDPDVDKATFKDEDSICNLLRPEKIVLHDLFDGDVRNSHAWGNEVIAYGRHHLGRNNIQEELQITADFVDMASSYTDSVYIVKSNHDEQIDRYLASYDPKLDPENSAFYYYMKYHQMKSVEMHDTGFSSFDPLEFWCRNPESGRGLSAENVTFLSRDDALNVKNFMLHFHGCRGTGGSRGSLKNLSKMGSPVIIGHSHSPNWYEGSLQVGVSARKDLNYAKGSPSSWLSTHAIVYPNSTATLLNIIEGEWRG